MEKDIDTILYEDSPKNQLIAIRKVLKGIDGWSIFKEIKKRGGREEIRRRLRLFGEMAEEDIDLEDKESAKRISDIALDYFDNKEFRKLSDLLFDIVVDHLRKSVGFQNSEEWTVYDLYRVMPDEVFLPFYFLESFTCEDGYNWEREEIIVENGLILLMTSFQLFYEGLDAFEESGKELPYREIL